MSKLINIDLVPNFENDDFEIIKKLLKNHHFFSLEESETKVKEILTSYFSNTEIYFFNSARSALTFLLENIFSEGEILTQAFSCLVVPNAIKFANLRPVYVDIDKSFNLDIEDLKKKINSKTKAIIIQNTFGLPAKIDQILEIARKNNLLIIENLTHSLGAKYHDVYLGNFGDIALLSFNRNKIISSIVGGALIIKNKNLNEKIKKNYQNLTELSLKEAKKILFTGKILYLAKQNYNFLMKLFLKFLRKKNHITEMISLKEKQGQKTENYLMKYPKVLFPLLENQLKKIERFNQHRIKIGQIYIDAGLKNFEINQDSKPVFLRFPIFSDDPESLLERFKKKNIYLGDWYRCVLAPCPQISLEKFNYQTGSCPVAESTVKKILNLPTSIELSENGAKKIIDFLK